jgi:hypothetical protein
VSLTFAQSQALAFARLEAIVRGATPLRMTDWPFTCVDDGAGNVAPLEEMVSGFRYFQWRHAEWTVRDSARVTCRVVHRLVVRIRYDLANLGNVDLERIIAEDLVVIDDALRIPSAWQMSSTGIKALQQVGPIGRTAGAGWHIVGMPYTLTLEACC